MLYTRPEIPVCSGNISIQEDIGRWPYLQGVFLSHFHAEVALLIFVMFPKSLIHLRLSTVNTEVRTLQEHVFTERLTDP